MWSYEVNEHKEGVGCLHERRSNAFGVVECKNEKQSRAMYLLSNTLLCVGDRGKWWEQIERVVKRHGAGTNKG